MKPGVFGKIKRSRKRRDKRQKDIISVEKEICIKQKTVF